MSFWKKKLDDEQLETQGETPLVLGKTPEAELLEKGKMDGRTAEGSPEKQASSLDPLPSNPEDILNERYGKTRSALSTGTVIQGKLSFDTPVRIDGKLSGEVYSSRALIVGPTGQVDAQVEVATLVVLGALRGNAKVSEKVEIWAGGSFEGNIVAPALVIQEGGQFSGDCKMIGVQGKETVRSKEALDTSNNKSENTKSETMKSETGKKKPNYVPPSQASPSPGTP